MTNEQRAVTAQSMVGSIVQALDAGAITTPVALSELKKLGDTVGLFASITDEDIAEAEEAESSMMPPTAEEMNADPAGPALQGVSGADENGASGRLVSEALEGNS